MSSAPPVNRVLVATDRSETADQAVRWAANLAEASAAELILVRVLLPAAGGRGRRSSRRPPSSGGSPRRWPGRAGARAWSSTPTRPRAIVAAAAETRADVLVVGNVGMSGRKQFLLGNIPNQISHNARCSVVIVNTAHLDGGEPAPTRAATDGRTVARPGAARAGRADRPGAGRHGPARRAGPPRRTRRARRARRRGSLRAALDELGPTFAKIGQILSTRPDLLPPAFVEELATLQDRVTPLTEAEVVVDDGARSSGVPWEDVFAGIDPQPLAAGTIAQVHRATLESGQKVVVKVQRPTAERGHQPGPAAARDAGRPGRPSGRACGGRSTCRRWSSTSRARCGASSTSARRPATSSACARCSRRTRGWPCRGSTASTRPRGCW